MLNSWPRSYRTTMITFSPTPTKSTTAAIKTETFKPIEEETL